MYTCVGVIYVRLTYALFFHVVYGRVTCVITLFLLTDQSQTVGTQQRIATPRLVRTYKFLYMYQGFKIMHASIEL